MPGRGVKWEGRGGGNLVYWRWSEGEEMSVCVVGGGGGGEQLRGTYNELTEAFINRTNE